MQKYGLIACFSPVISDTLLDGNYESLVFVTIWDCLTHVPMTSSVERTDLDFKISVALI